MRSTCTLMTATLLAAGCQTDDRIAATATCSWHVEEDLTEQAIDAVFLADTARGLRAIDEHGAVLDVAEKTIETNATGEHIRGVFTFGGDLFAYGDGVWHQTELGWETWFTLNGHTVRHVDADAERIVMLVDDGLGRLVWHFDAQTGAALPPAPITLVSYVAVDGDDVWAVGADRAARWEGEGWIVVELPDVAYDVVGAFEGELIFAGRQRVYGGRDAFAAVGEHMAWDIRGAWGTSAQDIWVLTPSQLKRFSGTEWTSQANPGAERAGASDGHTAWVISEGSASRSIHDVTQDAVLWHQGMRSDWAPSIALQEDGTTWLASGSLHQRTEDGWTSSRGGLANVVRARGDEVYVAGDGIASSDDHGEDWWAHAVSEHFIDVVFDDRYTYGVSEWRLWDLSTRTPLSTNRPPESVAMLDGTVLMYADERLWAGDRVLDDLAWRRVETGTHWENGHGKLFQLDGGGVLLAVDGSAVYQVKQDSVELLHADRRSIRAIWGRGVHDYLVVTDDNVYRYLNGERHHELHIGNLAIDGEGDDVVLGDANSFIRGRCR